MTEKFYRATGIFSVRNPFSLGSVEIGQLSNRNGGKVSSKRVGRRHFIQKKDGRKAFIRKRWDAKKLDIIRGKEPDKAPERRTKSPSCRHPMECKSWGQAPA